MKPPELPQIPGAETVIVEIDGHAFVVIVVGHGAEHDALLKDLRAMEKAGHKIRRAS